jgi:predicted nicotinamide N-methyase
MRKLIHNGKIVGTVFNNLFPPKNTEMIPEIWLHGEDEKKLDAYAKKYPKEFTAAQKEIFDGPAHWSVEYFSKEYPGFLGGACAAHWILHHRDEVKGLKALDIGSSTGVVAIAFAMAGAKNVVAVDKELFSTQVIQQNARANKVRIATLHDMVDGNFATRNAGLLKDAQIITFTDVFYSSSSEAMENLALYLVRMGKTVIAANCGGNRTRRLSAWRPSRNLKPEYDRHYPKCKRELNTFRIFNPR